MHGEQCSVIGCHLMRATAAHGECCESNRFKCINYEQTEIKIEENQLRRTLEWEYVHILMRGVRIGIGTCR